MSICNSTRSRLRSFTNPGVLRRISASRSMNAVEAATVQAPAAPEPIPARLNAPKYPTSLSARDGQPCVGLGIGADETSYTGNRGDVLARSVSESTRAISLRSGLASPVRYRAPSLRLISGHRDILANNAARSPRPVSSCIVAGTPALGQIGAFSTVSNSASYSAHLLPTSTSFSQIQRSYSQLSFMTHVSPLLAPLRIPPIGGCRLASTPPESPIAHARRSCRQAKMQLRSTPMKYTFTAQLRQGLTSEMVTAYVKRGNRLAVVVDAWHLEHDSHFEWVIGFAPRDVDMSSIRVVLESEGRLTVTVTRKQGVQEDGVAPPTIL